MTNSAEPEQTDPSLVWICTVCSDLSVPIIEIFTGSQIYYCIIFVFFNLQKFGFRVIVGFVDSIPSDYQVAEY